jgi:hypothetical protein
MGQEEEIKPIDKATEKSIDQTPEKQLVAEILASLEENQLTVKNGTSRDGFRHTPYRLSEATVAGHKVELMVIKGGEKRLKIDDQEFDYPEITNKMDLLSNAIVEQRNTASTEKELAEKELMADISVGLETATIIMRPTTEMRGSQKVRLNIYEGEVAGHKIKSVGDDILFIDDKNMPHSTDLLALIQKIQERAKTDISINETREKVEGESNT